MCLLACRTMARPMKMLKAFESVVLDLSPEAVTAGSSGGRLRRGPRPRRRPRPGPAGGTRGGLYEALTPVHKVGADLDPHAAVGPLVDLAPLQPKGRLYAEEGLPTVRGLGPPRVDGVVVGGRYLDPEARRRPRGVCGYEALPVALRTSPRLPARHPEDAFRDVIDDLRVVRQPAFFGQIPPGRHDLRRIRFGDGALRDEAVRGAVLSGAHCGTSVPSEGSYCSAVWASAERVDKKGQQMRPQRQHIKRTRNDAFVPPTEFSPASPRILIAPPPISSNCDKIL